MLCSRKAGPAFLTNMNFVNKKGTTKKPKGNVANFDDLKSQYLMDLKAIGPIKVLPDGMIVNWDQTAIKHVPSSNWTMAAEGSKRVEIVSIDDKHQITATFAGY